MLLLSWNDAKELAKVLPSVSNQDYAHAPAWDKFRKHWATKEQLWEDLWPVRKYLALTS